jgi:TRAP-type transport system periplasmic protein
VKINRFGIWLCVLGLASVLMAGSAGSCAKSSPTPAESTASTGMITLKLAIESFPEDSITLEINKFARSFNEHAKGKAEIVVYGNGSLGPSGQYIDMVRTGAIDLGVEPMVHNIPVSGVINLPFLLDNIAARRAAMEPILEVVFNKNFEKQFNQKPISWYPVAYHDLGSTSKPIKTMEEMKNMLIAVASPMQAKIVKALGGSSVVVEGPQVFGSLEKGVVDGIILPANAAIAMNLSQVMHYWTVCRIHTTYSSLNVCLDTFNKLPPDVQDILLEEGKKCGESTANRVDSEEMELDAVLKDSGVQLYELPAAERERWRQACLFLWDEEIARIGPDAKKITAIADEANQANP